MGLVSVEHGLRDGEAESCGTVWVAVGLGWDQLRDLRLVVLVLVGAASTPGTVRVLALLFLLTLCTLVDCPFMSISGRKLRKRCCVKTVKYMFLNTCVSIIPISQCIESRSTVLALEGLCVRVQVEMRLEPRGFCESLLAVVALVRLLVVRRVQVHKVVLQELAASEPFAADLARERLGVVLAVLLQGFRMSGRKRKLKEKD